MGVYDDPLGLGGRRPRLTEDETAERMFAAASEVVLRDGLRVHFGLLRLEDLIVEAGVSRAAVYKKWPRKEEFYGEVLLRLAGSIHPADAAYDSGTPRVAAETGLQHLAWLSDAAGRMRTIVEMCRVGALQNFNTLLTTKQWHTYMALHATLVSLPDNAFRAAMQEALGRSEKGFMVRMGRFYEAVMPALGFSLREDIEGFSADDFAELGGSIVEGLVLVSGGVPELATRRFEADPFHTGYTGQWSFPALGFASLATTFFAQTDTTDWGADAIERARRSLYRLADFANQDRRTGDN